MISKIKTIFPRLGLSFVNSIKKNPVKVYNEFSYNQFKTIEQYANIEKSIPTSSYDNTLFNIGDNTQLFLTEDILDKETLIDIRPVCMYANNLNNIESDLKYSALMKKNDTFLFNNINELPLNLVKEWIANKNEYKTEYTKLQNTYLYTEIINVLYEVVYNKGYQFHLGMLLKQFKLLKHYWLIELTKKMLKRDNLNKIIKFANQDGYIIKSVDNDETWTSQTIFVDNNIIILDNHKNFDIHSVYIQANVNKQGKYINKNPNDRFVQSSVLKDAYITDNVINEKLNPYITLLINNDDLEFGIVDTSSPFISNAISSLLTRSVEMSKDIHGGYVPADIINNAQKEYVSPYGITNLWGATGYRFVLSRKVSAEYREIIGTALITKNASTLFFLSSKYHNLIDFDTKCITMKEEKDEWFNRFATPSLESYKIPNYNQLANFAIEGSHRGNNLGKIMLSTIIKYYSAINVFKTNKMHSQPLLYGDGIFQIADPAWRKRMLKNGLKLRMGAESFYVDGNPDFLDPVILNNEIISNIEFNNMFDMPQIYENNHKIEHNSIHLVNRIPLVKKLAQSNMHKLQYYQLYCEYDNYKN